LRFVPTFTLFPSRDTARLSRNCGAGLIDDGGGEGIISAAQEVAANYVVKMLYGGVSISQICRDMGLRSS
jgi:hypothetical protein